MSKYKRNGFTLVELLMVVAIMAVVATLATNAALKAIVASREKRIDAAIRSLETALVTYRALNGEWSFSIDSGTDKTLQSIDNETAFKGVIEATRAGQALLEPGALLTRVGGRRMSVREAMETGRNSMPIGYANSKNQNEFITFSVQYNRQTDSVKVAR